MKRFKKSFDEKYCPNCGANLPDEMFIDFYMEMQPRHNPWKWAFFLLLFLVVGATAAWYFKDYINFGDDENTEFPIISGSLYEAANRYDELGEFYNGVAKVRKGDNYFYINTQGELVDPPTQAKSREHTPDKTNLVRIEEGGRWGAINRNSRDTVISLSYSTLGNFYDGYALATLSFGDPSMPEYKCFYGYVDTQGNDTFLPEYYKAIAEARSALERRQYLESLPSGITARATGLNDNARRVTFQCDSTSMWEMTFGPDGVLQTYRYSTQGAPTFYYNVSEGYITSMSYERNNEVHLFKFPRRKTSDTREEIFRLGANENSVVGHISYSADDGTVQSWSFESLPSVADAYTESTDEQGRPVAMRIPSFNPGESDIIIKIKY